MNLILLDMQIRNIDSFDYYKHYTDLINSNITFESFDSFVKELDDHHIIIVAEDNNLIIASGTLFIEKKLTYGISFMGHIENITVHPDYRNKGIGKTIVKYLIDLAETKKCYRIDLSCVEELQHFYESNNFKKNQITMSILLEKNFKK